MAAGDKEVIIIIHRVNSGLWVSTIADTALNPNTQAVVNSIVTAASEIDNTDVFRTAVELEADLAALVLAELARTA